MQCQPFTVPEQGDCEWVLTFRNVRRDWGKPRGNPQKVGTRPWGRVTPRLFYPGMQPQAPGFTFASVGTRKGVTRTHGFVPVLSLRSGNGLWKVFETAVFRSKKYI